MSTSRTARASACGKVILLGEHAVVYGVPALAAGIDRGARAEATLRSANVNASASPNVNASTGVVSSLDPGGGAVSSLDPGGGAVSSLDPGGGAVSSLDLGGGAVTASARGDDDLSRAFAALLGDDAPAVDVSASSDLPPGGGLGSSAALGVSIARAVEELAGTPEPDREPRALARALAWERVFHGNPSGIDTYAAAHGGAFRFIRGEPAHALHPATDLWLCVGLSGAGASTRAMVEGLARLFQRKPDLKKRSIDAIAALVSNAALAIEAGDVAGLGKLMDLNHMVLAGLFLSTEALERLCHLARQAGALGAKLTGSGGGGSVIALVPPPEDPSRGPGPTAAAVLDAWKQAGFDGFATRIAAGAD